MDNTFVHGGIYNCDFNIQLKLESIDEPTFVHGGIYKCNFIIQLKMESIDGIHICAWRDL